MQNVIFSESKFKKMAQRLSREQRKAGVHLPHQSVLQMLSRAIFDKPYEEVRATSFAPDTPASQSVAPAVNISKSVYAMLQYGNESILLKDGEYISGNYPGTDLAVSERVYMDNAKALAASFGASLIQERLPEILPEGFDTDDVIRLARKLGMLQDHDSIFNLIEESGVIKIDGRVTEYTLCGEYLSDVETAFKNGEIPFEVCIWMPETIDKVGLHEYYFTLGELSRARTSDGGKTWVAAGRVIEFLN